VPFEREDAMITALKRTGAEVVVLCGSDPVMRMGAFAERLLAGDVPVWLTPISGSGDGFVLLAVDRGALGALP
jgi:hypothetical protein